MTWFQLFLLTGVTWACLMSIPAVAGWYASRIEVRRVIRAAERITRIAAKKRDPLPETAQDPKEPLP